LDADVTASSAEFRDASRRWSAAELAVAAVAFALAAAAIAARTGRPPSTLALVAAAAFFLIVPGGYIAFSVEGVRRSLSLAVAGLASTARLIAGPVLLLVVVAGYALASGLPFAPRVGAYAAYLIIPPLFLAAPATTVRGRQLPLRELAVVFALWLPIEFRVLPPLPLPAPNGVDMRKLVGLVEAMYLFLAARPLARIGYTYRLTRLDATTAVMAFLVYAVVAVPIGLGTGFIAWRPELDATHLLGAPLIIYLVTGVPEEFLFRGLLQNLLTDWLGPRAGLVIASIIFGFAHLPDLRYVLLAAIAGLAYGWVYLRTERITASAITHALVDATWAAFLRG
jgi:membrane protease YdiL (CAAX protease family)